MSYEIFGIDELIRLFDELGKSPQTVATKAARAGALIDLSATKNDAPVYDGWLKASLTLVGERAKVQGKKVYEVTFDRAYNAKLVKYSKNGNRSYYPASQEFGWKYPGGGYHVGLQYMKNNANAKAAEVDQKMIDVAKTAVDKILAKAR